MSPSFKQKKKDRKTPKKKLLAEVSSLDSLSAKLPEVASTVATPATTDKLKEPTKRSTTITVSPTKKKASASERSKKSK